MKAVWFEIGLGYKVDQKAITTLDWLLKKVRQMEELIVLRKNRYSVDFYSNYMQKYMESRCEASFKEKVLDANMTVYIQ